MFRCVTFFHYIIRMRLTMTSLLVKFSSPPEHPLLLPFCVSFARVHQLPLEVMHRFVPTSIPSVHPSFIFQYLVARHIGFTLLD